MKFTTFAIAVVTAGAVASCAHSEAQSPRVAGASGCNNLSEDGLVEQVYSPGAIYAAKPIKKRIFYARANQPVRTVGAKMYLHAPQGVTGEYLERRLACHAQSGTSAHPNDPLHPSVGSVKSVSVDSTGGSFAINIVAKDPKTGQEIWQRAEALSGTGDASVQQVGAATQTNGQL